MRRNTTATTTIPVAIRIGVQGIVRESKSCFVDAVWAVSGKGSVGAGSIVSVWDGREPTTKGVFIELPSMILLSVSEKSISTMSHGNSGAAEIYEFLTGVCSTAKRVDELRTMFLYESSIGRSIRNAVLLKNLGVDRPYGSVRVEAKGSTVRNTGARHSSFV